MRSSPAFVVSALGVIEIFTWGSTFYLIAILAGPVMDETGWSATLVSGGLSAALLSSGLAAPVVGNFIQTLGGRKVLTGGLIVLAFGQVLLGFSGSVTTYYGAWVVIGIGMAATLYDAAFSVIAQIFAERSRSRIAQLTLWGGFASTVCWPISGWLVETFGWRETCFAYAAFYIAVLLPTAIFALRAKNDEGALPTSELKSKKSPPLPITNPAFLALALAGTLLAAISTFWSVHFITLLSPLGYSLAAAVWLGTLIGPSQVFARTAEMFGRERYHPVWTMLVSTGLVMIGFVGLLFALPAAMVMVFYGAGNGLWSIARGALPLALFGVEGYARTMGRLAAPALVGSAAAPFFGAFLIETIGEEKTLLYLALVSVVPLVVCLGLMLATSRSRRTAPVKPPPVPDQDRR